jgi:hypothetical protein
MAVARRGFDKAFLIWVSTVRLAVRPSLSNVCRYFGVVSIDYIMSPFGTDSCIYLFDICIGHLADGFRRCECQVVQTNKREEKVLGYNFRRALIANKTGFPSPFESFAF